MRPSHRSSSDGLKTEEVAPFCFRWGARSEHRVTAVFATRFIHDSPTTDYLRPVLFSTSQILQTFAGVQTFPIAISPCSGIR